GSVELTIVGSGTAAPHPRRVSAAHHIRAGKISLLLDCGPGAVHRMAGVGVEWNRLTHVAVSHFHTDHVGDLPMLLFALKYALPAPRTEDLVLVLPPGGRAWIERLAAAFGEYILDPGFAVHVRELEPGATLDLGDAARIAAHKTPHTQHSVAYRVGIGARSVGYTGDTGVDVGQEQFFREIGRAHV